MVAQTTGNVLIACSIAQLLLLLLSPLFLSPLFVVCIVLVSVAVVAAVDWYRL